MTAGERPSDLALRLNKAGILARSLSKPSFLNEAPSLHADPVAAAEAARNRLAAIQGLPETMQDLLNGDVTKAPGIKATVDGIVATHRLHSSLNGEE